MKALIVTMLFPVLLKSCEGQPDKIGTPPPPINTATGGGGGTGSGGGAGTDRTTDAPIDGGLGILLLAGTAYGIKRYRNSKQKNAE